MEPFPDIKYQIDLLDKSNHFSTEFLKFYEQLLTVQQSNKERINKPLISILARTIDLDERLSDGRPLIDDINFYVDPQVAQSLLQELLDLLKRSQAPDRMDEILKLKSATEHQTFNLTVLLKILLGRKKAIS